jgi:hypothetical protein
VASDSGPRGCRRVPFLTRPRRPRSIETPLSGGTDGQALYLPWLVRKAEEAAAGADTRSRTRRARRSLDDSIQGPPHWSASSRLRMKSTSPRSCSLGTTGRPQPPRIRSHGTGSCFSCRARVSRSRKKVRYEWIPSSQVSRNAFRVSGSWVRPNQVRAQLDRARGRAIYCRRTLEDRNRGGDEDQTPQANTRRPHLGSSEPKWRTGAHA